MNFSIVYTSKILYFYATDKKTTSLGSQSQLMIEVSIRIQDF